MDSNTNGVSNQNNSNKDDLISNKMTPELWSSVTPYLPNILLDKVILSPHKSIPWIDPVEGTLVFADILIDLKKVFL